MKPFFKNKNPYLFVRFGSLNLKKQKHYIEVDKSFHNPPVKFGFYAMPYILQEWFLIGSIAKFQPEVFGKEINYNDIDWEKHEKKIKKIKQQIRKIFEKKEGFIWHHLDVKNPVKISGSWNKSTMKTWEKALRKTILRERMSTDWQEVKGKISEIKGINGYYSKDHYEVFIDEKI